MADNLSQLTQRDLLDMVLHTAQSGAWAGNPASVWVGLCSAAPTDTATNEVTVGLNYNRMAVTFSAATTASPAVSTGPSATTTYTSASGTGWGTISGYVLAAASTGSTGLSRYIAYGSISPNVTVVSNDVVEFAAGAITLSFT
jgi:hypothetical protein